MTTYEDIQAQLSWVCDAILPGDEDLGMPSASGAGVVTQLLPRALKVRDDHAEDFIQAVASLPADVPADRLATISDSLSPESFDLVTHLIAGAYYLNADVNAKLGYKGQESLPYDPDFDEISEIADRVIARGPVWIDTRTGQRGLPSASGA
ncbi:hypothetical protein ACRDU6_00050 (plasmid) [Mycolicibacterium sp. ELW1]|uniref:hypothetical protein n=1 Tax=Mycobacteriaceae TaxID=1762 RepID=UPI0011EF947B|nr:hypothetical protein [Mycobacterium sp. ELW1]QEN17569.1 hypothetical protein D3H54_30260 [Mycobacterium sp. ELW1]